MVQITVELVRKRAEHHDCQLAPLEEIALHQESIEKIEYLQDWCPKLKILLMQSNLIAKIENLNKLKHLNYLNLALNNIELIENLERCESLNKLDLTLNFIGELTSVESLIGNYNLETLYLTGNPCTDYDNYREYVVATLPQLTSLDGVDIERSDRIMALQKLKQIRPDIVFDEKQYRYTRMKQKQRLNKDIADKWRDIDETNIDDERVKQFWQEKCEHSPEVRYEMEKFKNLKLKQLNNTEEKEPKRKLMLFNSEGRPFNINQPKVDFNFSDHDPKKYVLDVAVFKHMDTSLIDVDVQPYYVRVTMKGKIFQLCLPEEINVDKSTAQRSETTGHLVITMPIHDAHLHTSKPFNYDLLKKTEKPKPKVERTVISSHNKREFLEIGSSASEALDFTAITRKNKNIPTPLFVHKTKQPSSDFIDDPDVPPLA